MPLSIGSVAPDFELPSTDGSEFKLYDHQEPIILFFYPKDFTRVCTKEACDYRDHFVPDEIKILGISTDNIQTHHKFKKENQLPYELLADVGGRVSRKYEALIPLVGLSKRISYLLDKDHRIVAIHKNLFDHQGHIKSMKEAMENQEN